MYGTVSNNLLKLNKNHNDTESEDNISLCDESDCDLISEDDDQNEKPLPNIGDFVLVKLEIKSLIQFFISTPKKFWIKTMKIMNLK